MELKYLLPEIQEVIKKGLEHWRTTNPKGYWEVSDFPGVRIIPIFWGTPPETHVTRLVVSEARSLSNEQLGKLVKTLLTVTSTVSVYQS